MPPFNQDLILTEKVNTDKISLQKRSFLPEMSDYNLMVILSKLSQKRLRNSQWKHAPFPKTRVVMSLIEKCHVTLKIVKQLKFFLICNK